MPECCVWSFARNPEIGFGTGRVRQVRHGVVGCSMGLGQVLGCWRAVEHQARRASVRWVLSARPVDQPPGSPGIWISNLERAGCVK